MAAQHMCRARGAAGSSSTCRHQLQLLAATVALCCVLLSAAPAAGDSRPTNPNPYAGKSYGGCAGNFCPSGDPALEHEFWGAAAKGDLKAVQRLLVDERLNLTRNVVPDDDGLARVLDVAVWAASERGHRNVMKALLSHPGVLKLYEYEDGHIVELAAAKGDAKMVKLLLDMGMPVGASSMAHAAHFNHTDVMELLLAKPMDLKSAMQAISNGGSPEVAKVLMQAIKKQEAGQEVEQASGAYDWHGDYVALAVRAGNMPVLKVLLETGWVLKWQQAEDLIRIAAEQGSPDVLGLLLDQPLFKSDPDELDEAVDVALKTAAEHGKVAVAQLLLQKLPEQAKAHCKKGVFRAMKYGFDDVVAVLTAVCPVDVAGSIKLQDAQWLGQLLNAARAGDAATIKTLLQDKKAAARIRKLQAPVDEDSKAKRLPSDPLINLAHDPLVLAAIGGHLDAVKALENTELLCPPCAAAQAAKSNRTEVVQHLAAGTAKVMMQGFEDVIQNALRVVAYSMENGNWPLVRWMLKQHGSRELGPYFLPVIATEGKINDMRAMLGALAELGYTKGTYFTQQVHSALISAALAGQLDLVLKLQQHSTAGQPAEADAAGGGDDSGSADKSEL